MSDYTETVTKLRDVYRAYVVTGNEKAGQFLADAAAAIEELQADQKKTVTQIFCEEQAAWEGRCKDLMKQISELQADNKEMLHELEDAAKQIRELQDEVLSYASGSQPHWVSVEERLPEPNVQCLVRDDDGNCAVGYYRQDAKAWDSPFFGWVERDDEYYQDGDLCRIGKVVAWMPLPEPPQESDK